MPYDIRVIQSRDFIRLDARGHVDLEKSRGILADLAGTCTRNRVDRVLLDTRQVTADLDTKDVYLLACAFAGMGFEPQDRLAILHRPFSFDRPEFFATCARVRGCRVEAFGAFEDAFNWLNDD